MEAFSFIAVLEARPSQLLIVDELTMQAYKYRNLQSNKRKSVKYTLSSFKGHKWVSVIWVAYRTTAHRCGNKQITPLIFKKHRSSRSSKWKFMLPNQRTRFLIMNVNKFIWCSCCKKRPESFMTTPAKLMPPSDKSSGPTPKVTSQTFCPLCRSIFASPTQWLKQLLWI